MSHQGISEYAAAHEVLRHYRTEFPGLDLILAQREDRRTGTGDVESLRTGGQKLFAKIVVARNELLPVRLDNNVTHAPADKTHVPVHETGHQTAHIRPLQDCIMKRNVLRKHGTALGSLDRDARMGYCGAERIRERNPDIFKRRVGTDQDDSSENRRSDVVRMLCAAAGESLAFHRELDHLLFRETVPQKGVQRHDRTGGRSRAGADSASRHDLAHESDFQMLAYSCSGQHGAYRRSHHIIVDTGRDIIVRPVDDFNSVAFGHFHAEDVSGAFHGHTHDVETATEVRNRSRDKDSYLFYHFSRCFIYLANVGT